MEPIFSKHSETELKETVTSEIIIPKDQLLGQKNYIVAQITQLQGQLAEIDAKLAKCEELCIKTAVEVQEEAKAVEESLPTKEVPVVETPIEAV